MGIKNASLILLCPYLYNSGVQISEPASGVAIGLVTQLDENNEITDYKLLTDILVSQQ